MTSLLTKKVTIKKLREKCTGMDYYDVQDVDLRENLEIVEEVEKYADSLDFVSFLKKNKTFTIEECIKQFPMVCIENYIGLLNDVIGHQNRFVYEFDAHRGYNSNGFKNAYMIDTLTNEKYYIG